jgi:lipopolysaccharide transport system permease protein
MSASQPLVIEARRPFHLLDVKELVEYRDLLAFLTWRDIAIRYKQSVLGYAWAFLQPLAQVIMFSLIFGVMLDVPSGDVPYPLLALTGVMAWTYFSGAVMQSATSVVAQQAVVTKVYFPRVLVPLAPSLALLVDIGISLALSLAIALVWTKHIYAALALVPLYVILLVATTIGLGLLLAAANVRYRDVRQGMGLLLQIGMYATPIIWPLETLRQRLPDLYWLIGINPIATVVQGFRAGLLGMEAPTLPMVLASVASCAVIMLVGLWYFHATEDAIADIV